jgi:DNA-binding winged helix-turn-helix (wHTH) protein/Tol biopolymer transport system component
MSPKSRIAKFGPFQFDFAERELRQRNRRVPLSVSLLKLLALFLDRPGQLITRDEIAEVLWADKNTVDIEMGINTAVRRLRAQLGDESAAPIYIETLIGIGYRFIAPVEKLAATADQSEGGLSPLSQQTEPAPGTSSLPAASSQPAAAPINRAVRWRIPLVSAASVALLLMLIVAIDLGSVYWRHRSDLSASTQREAPFFSRSPLQVTFDNEEDRLSAQSVSPDGKSLAYSDHVGVFIYSIDDGADRRLSMPPSFDIERLAWAPDGRSLLASGITTAAHRRQVWVVSTPGNPPHMLLDDAGLAVASPDGLRIAFTREQDSEIWIADADGRNAHPLVRGNNGDSFIFLLWSPDSRRLIYDRHNAVAASRSDSTSTAAYTFDKLDTQNRWTYESMDSVTGALLAIEDNIRFDSAFLLKDGRLFYPVNDAPGDSKLMMARTDPQSGRFMSPPRALGSSPVWGASRVDNVTSLSASATGAEVGAVVERRMADVFYATLRAPGPTLANITRITGHSQSNFPHAWTPNADAVIFDNSNSGGSTISKQRLGTVKMELVAKLPEKAAMAEFTPDGKWIMFMEFIGWPSRVIGVFSVPADGGTPQQLSVAGTIDEFHCPVASKGTCVMRETLGNKQFVFYALDPVHGMGPELGRMDWMPTTLGDWSISPDSSTVAMANHDPAHPGIQLTTFAAGAASRTSSIPVLGFGTILEPTWSSDGKGFFVESKTVTGYDLLYVNLDGHVRLLRESPIPIWGVPSRDDRKLAFPAQTVSINVWVGPTALL